MAPINGFGVDEMGIVEAVLAALREGASDEETLAKRLWPELQSPWATEPGILQVLEVLERRGLAKKENVQQGGHRFSLTEDGKKASERVRVVA